MAELIFHKILDRAWSQGIFPAKTQAARDWFRSVSRRTRITPERLHSQASSTAYTKQRMQNTVRIGQMYSFFYDPKHKKTLPYYDTFPLIFPIGRAPGGFYGINFHYLPYKARAVLMDSLYDLSTDKRYDENTKLKISYAILNKSAKYKWFKPALHHYLKNHVRSNFLQVYSDEWDIAIMLPVARFEKASREKVWRDSKNAI